MSTIKNGQISLYCHFNKIIKEPGTNFQSPALTQNHVRNFHFIFSCFYYERTCSYIPLKILECVNRVIFQSSFEILFLNIPQQTKHVQTGWPIFSKKIQRLFKEFSRIFFKSQGHKKKFGGFLKNYFKKTLDSN